MARMANMITTCRRIEGLDKGCTRQTPVWRAETFRRGLNGFCPALKPVGVWVDFESAEAAFVFVGLMNANPYPLLLEERIEAWGYDMALITWRFLRLLLKRAEGLAVWPMRDGR